MLRDDPEDPKLHHKQGNEELGATYLVRPDRNLPILPRSPSWPSSRPFPLIGEDPTTFPLMLQHETKQYPDQAMGPPLGTLPPGHD